MTHKEIAEIIRRGQPDELSKLADEFDPPGPEPGTVVWWQDVEGLSDPALGQSNEWGMIEMFGTKHSIDPASVTYWPARILAPDEVAVKVPPVSKWGSIAVLHIQVRAPQGGVTFSDRTITRAEAEEMEADR